MENDFDMHLNTKTRGSGDGLILIHGFGGSIFSWEHMMPALGQTRQVVAMDLLGHGDSPKPEESEYTIENQARLVQETIDTLCMNRFILCGHSYGGGVILQIAWDIIQGNFSKALSGGPSPESERLEGMIIISGAAYPQALPWHLQGMKSPYSLKLNGLVPPEAQMRLVLLSLFYNPLNVTKQIVSGYAWPMRSPGYYKALHKTVKNIIPDNPDALPERYQQINAPALLIWGEKDRIVPPELGKKLHLDLHNSEFHVLPDCGHMPMHEKPIEVLNLIINWMERL